MEVASPAPVPETVPKESLRDRWRSFTEVLRGPKPDESIIRQRVRFVERNIGIWVKAALAPLIYWFLFGSSQGDEHASPREDLIAYLRNFALIMTAVNVGASIVYWGMDEISTRLLERVVYVSTVLDAAFLAALTLYCGGFDSILYWVFLGLIIRNAAVIAHAEVQLLVNLVVSAFYVLAGVLELGLGRIEDEVLASYMPGARSSLSVGEGAIEPFESLVMRVLLMLLFTVLCLGLQMLLDRQRQSDVEAREFALKQEQLEAAGRLAAEIAHQLKNPLGIINNAAYTLHKTVREGKTITQQIAIIREEVARSDRIITDLMGYARLAEGRVERVTVAEVVEQSLAVALPEGSGFEVQVQRDIPGSLPVLLGQRAHFVEILTNLLVNAREAMDGRGHIWITARTTPDFAVQIGVRDDGPGIPADKLAEVWEPYFTTKERGTGLGLAIVRHNTEMYGGRARVESEVGSGTTFTVTLPARTVMRLR